MKIIRVGVDLAKRVFQVHGVDCDERPALRRKLHRETWMDEMVKHIEPGCVIGMEACAGVPEEQDGQFKFTFQHGRLLLQ